ncbi:dephospho-CoA kinase [bacterium]|nr:dephospho-CoA kinase [bacterium]
MIKVALVGNIASGKSLAENYLKTLYPVADTDIIAHELLKTSQNLIIEAFSDFDICENGTLSRKKLADIVFSNSGQKQKLENILHPLIKKEVLNFFENNSSSDLVFVSVPLLFESHFDKLFDKTIFIFANDNLRLQRLMKRNNLTEQQALIRIKSQLEQEEKIPLCDFVIKNETTPQDLYNKIQGVLNQII